jgi:poly-gamma-glutamate capsule biosynthesis protein CapA/YwtB (metallophosphatase superfamily)/outer membrane protein assembly factor BamB
MRRLAMMAVLWIAWCLASCGAPRGADLTSAPTTSPVASQVPVATSKPTRTPVASPTSRPTAPPSATSTELPAAQPTTPPSPIPSPPTPTSLPALGPAGTPIAGEPLAFSLDWRHDSGGHLTAGAVTQLSDETAYLLASLGRRVHALTGEGQVRWQARARGPVYDLVALDDGRIAVGDDAGYVTLLDAAGHRIWRHDLGSRVTAVEGIWQGGLLAGGWDERLTLLSLEPEGERVQWQAAAGGPVSAIVTLPDRAVVSSLAGELRASDPAGSELWRFDAGSPVTGLSLAAGPEGAVVLAGVQDGRLLALAPDGALLWEQSFGQATAGSPVFHTMDPVGDGTPAVVLGSGGDNPQLALLSGRGESEWHLAVPSAVGALSSVDLDGDGGPEILAGLASGEVQAFDLEGRYRGSLDAGLSVWDIVPAADSSALLLADVVAWRLVGTAGPSGGQWLPAPAMVTAAPEVPDDALGGVTLVFLGDVALGRSVEARLARYGPAYPWEGLGPLLREADLAVANLEGVLTTQGKPLDKTYLMRAHPGRGETLVEAGFDLVTLANNHALDYGEAGLDETVATLEELDIAMVGAGETREAAHRPAHFTLDGVKVAVLGYAAARWNGSPDVPATDRIAWAEEEDVRAGVRAVRDEVDVVVVLLHAGTEYAKDPSPDQVAVARAAIDAGADLVVGHHPHVTQTVERYRGGLIVYSLGDALFDIPRPAAMSGHLLRVRVTREGLAEAELWPFWIDEAIRPRLLDDGTGAPRVRIVYP